MSEMTTAAQPRCENWREGACFPKIFRALQITAFNPSVLVAAFLGVIATLVVGFMLDFVWLSGSSPYVEKIGGVTHTEMDTYLSFRGDAKRQTQKWIADLNPAGKPEHEGVFVSMMRHARRSLNVISMEVVQLNLRGLLQAITRGFAGISWLVSMHPFYALIFAILKTIIWGFFGGAICRAAALQFARNESITPREAFKYARSHLFSFVLAPIFPGAVLVVVALMLWGFGIIGTLPWLGELIVGVLFIIPLVLGFVAALVAIGTVVIYPMLSPGIAADDLDPGDAVATSASFVTARPWSYALLLLVSVAYGAFCIVLVKFFVCVMLWLTGMCMGSSMNWSSASVTDAAGKAVSDGGKLSAMWQAPRPGAARPFIGTFAEPNLRSTSQLGSWCIRMWIFGLWGVVAAFGVGFFYSASTIIYFIMRRYANDTDMEDVYLERTEPVAASPAVVAK